MLPKTVLLKNNKEVLIRQAVPGDAAALIACIRQYIQDSDHLLLTAEEFQPTEQQEQAWIRSFRDSDNGLLLLAFHGERLVGNIDLSGAARQKLRHTAMVGMGMLKEWRNTGLGSHLLRTAIDWARANPVLEQLWLQVYHNNEAGLALYRKCGFREQGRQEAFIRMPDGQYADNLLMSLPVK